MLSGMHSKVGPRWRKPFRWGPWALGSPRVHACTSPTGLVLVPPTSWLSDCGRGGGPSWGKGHWWRWCQQRKRTPGNRNRSVRGEPSWYTRGASTSGRCRRRHSRERSFASWWHDDRWCPKEGWTLWPGTEAWRHHEASSCPSSTPPRTSRRHPRLASQQRTFRQDHLRRQRLWDSGQRPRGWTDQQQHGDHWKSAGKKMLGGEDMVGIVSVRWRFWGKWRS